MRVALSSEGERRDTQVEPWLGRAAYFLIVDTDSMIFDPLEKESPGESPELEEINAARLIVDAGVQAMLTGNCGHEARRLFATAGITVFQSGPGTVEKAVEQYQAGRLVEVPAPGLREPVEAGVPAAAGEP